MISFLSGSFYWYFSNGLLILIGLVIIIKNESVSAYARRYHIAMVKLSGLNPDEAVPSPIFFRVCHYIGGAMAVIRGTLNLISTH